MTVLQFMFLKLRKECKAYIRWEKAKLALDYRIIKTKCSLEVGYADFRGGLTWMHENNRQGLLNAKKPFT